MSATDTPRTRPTRSPPPRSRSDPPVDRFERCAREHLTDVATLLSSISAHRDGAPIGLRTANDSTKQIATAVRYSDGVPVRTWLREKQSAPFATFAMRASLLRSSFRLVMTLPNVRALCARVSISHPIVQAPMAGVSTPAMAAAVSNAGGLGSLGVGATNADGAHAMITAFRERSAGSLNVNVFCHAPAKADGARERAWIDRLRPELERFGAKAPSALSEIYQTFLVDDAMLAMLVAVKPKVVSFHFGIPSPERVRALRDAGIVVFASATSLAEARLVVAGGAEVVVAQGYEAGGHRGVFDPDGHDDRLGTLALTRLLVRAVDVPVIAAGGIMDGAGVAAVLRLGASAAQLGTAFVTTTESAADEGYRRALASDAAHHTVMTRAISGRPARCLANRFTALSAEVDPAAIPDYPIAYDLGKALHAAAKAHGESGYGAQWAGQGAPLARTMGAGDLTRLLIDEMTSDL